MIDDAEAPTRWEKILHRAKLDLGLTFMGGLTVLMISFMISADPNELARFSVELAAVEGLDPTTLGRTVSPAFNLTVRVDNPSAMRRWCSNGGEVLVSYEGVTLAWGQVPALCVKGSATAELTLLPWGWEVGLSEDLRRHLASECSMGTAQVLVETKIFQKIGCMRRFGGTSFHSFKFMLR